MHMRRQIYLIQITILFVFIVRPGWSQLEAQHTNGPDGAAISVIVSDGEYAFYGDEFFLYRTSDGKNWEKLPYPEMYPMAGSPGLIAAFQHKGWGDSQYPERFVVSKDHGATWQEGTNPELPGVSYDRMVVCSHGIYIPQANDQVVWRSDDEGISWHAIDLPEGVGGWVKAVDDRLLMRSGTQIFELDPQAETWSEFSSAMPGGSMPHSLAYTGSVWFAATTASVFKSEDDGSTWEKVLDHNTKELYSDLLWTGQWICIADKYGKFYCSKDLGQNWSEFQETMSFNYILQGMSQLKDFILIPTYDQGVFRFDPENWTISAGHSGLGSAVIYDLEQDNGIVWAATGIGISSFDVESEVWSNVLDLYPDYQLIKVVSDGKGRLATAGQLNRFVLLSSDYGATWDSIDVSDPWGPWLIVDIQWHNEQLYVFFEGPSVVRLDPNTLGFVPVDVPKYPCFFQGNYWAVSPDGKVMSCSSLEGSWQEFENVPEGLLRLYTAGDKMLAITIQNEFSALYVTENGVDWYYANDGLPQIYISELFDNVFKGDAWRIGTFYYFYFPGAGLFQSMDECQTWHLLGAKNTADLIFQDSLFYMGGFGGGVWRSGSSWPFLGTANGFAYIDKNANGEFDAPDQYASYVRVEVYEENGSYPVWSVNTKANGSYLLPITTGEINTVRPVGPGKYIQNILPIEYTIQESTDSLDFAIQLQPDITDMSISMTVVGPLRPGFESLVFISCKNEGTIPASGEIGIKLDPSFQYVNASPAPTKFIGGDSLVWSFQDLPVWSSMSIHLTGLVATSATIGQIMTFSGIVLPSQIDADLADNSDYIRQAVVASYDPNDKAVAPEQGLTKAQIESGDELIYTIRFQNTGNFYAERVRIMDQLDTALNMQTLRFLNASHDVTAFDLLPNRWLQIVFDQIMLPDSNENELESHGFVRFAIQRNKQYNPDISVPNEARIYFDYNDPILTNTVLSELYDPTVSIDWPQPDPSEGRLLILYPNPAHGHSSVWTNGLLQGGGTLRILNMKGDLVLTKHLADCADPVHVPLQGFSAGTYLLEIDNGHKSMYGKLVVQ